MIFSLETDSIESTEYDYVIVGGGTVGLIFAKRLAERTVGKSILVIESGSKCRENEHANILNAIVNRSKTYDGAVEGRRRAIGGTSTVWGGAMLAFQNADLTNANWPVTLNELTCYEPEIDEIFGLEPFETDQNIDCTDFIRRRCKWPSFTNRNVRNILSNYLGNPQSYDLLCDATVTRMTKIEQCWTIQIRSLGWKQAEVSCSKLIISAGAIETTRLAMLIDRDNNRLISKNTPSLGHFFSDHISVGVAELLPINQKQFNKKYLFKFGKRGTMSNVRYEFSEQSDLRKWLPPVFLHIGYRIDGPTTFGFLREIYQAVQNRVLPSARSVFGVLRGMPWMVKAAYWRIFHQVVLWPTGSKIILNVVVEQARRYQNQVDISKDKFDAIGQEKVTIDWNIDEQDKWQILNTAKVACDFLESHESDMLTLSRFSQEQILSELEVSSGIFHPTCSTIMGADPNDSVVDGNLALHADKSVYLLSTSVFPSGGGANPTKMLLLFAYRLADFLSIK